MSDLIYPADYPAQQFPKSECTEDMDGNFWKDDADLTSCRDCGGVLHIDDCKGDTGLCESCYDDNYTECDGCRCDYHNDDLVHPESGGEYCDDCYNETFSNCGDCGCECYREDMECIDYDAYCEDCADSHRNDDGYECRANYNWANRGGYTVMKSERCFGLELETSYATGYSDWIGRTSWGVTTDGSISGMEFVSPILQGDDGLASVTEVAGGLDRAGCEVDSRCGVHLHIDLRDCNPDERKAIALAYMYCCDFWHACIDESRRDIEYSRLHTKSRRGYAYDRRQDVGSDYWDRKAIIESQDGHPVAATRYVWCNWNAYNSHKTVEIRMHHATLDGRALCNWAKAHTRFVDYVKKLSVAKVTRIFGRKGKMEIMRVMREIWADAELSDYYGEKVAARETVTV